MDLQSFDAFQKGWTQDQNNNTKNLQVKCKIKLNLFLTKQKQIINNIIISKSHKNCLEFWFSVR